MKRRAFELFDEHFFNTGDRAVVGAAAGAFILGETIGGAVPAIVGALGGAALSIMLGRKPADPSPDSRQQG